MSRMVNRLSYEKNLAPSGFWAEAGLDYRVKNLTILRAHISS
jgi:hypothetical protein